MRTNCRRSNSWECFHLRSRESVIIRDPLTAYTECEDDGKWRELQKNCKGAVGNKETNFLTRCPSWVKIPSPIMGKRPARQDPSLQSGYKSKHQYIGDYHIIVQFTGSSSPSKFVDRIASRFCGSVVKYPTLPSNLTSNVCPICFSSKYLA